MKALIIEDDANMAAVLKSYFEGLGFVVTITASMSVAAEIIRETPDLHVITVDLNLTDSRAAQTLSRIPEIRSLRPNALLLVVSGVLTEADKKVCAELGADATFEKLDVPTEKTFMQKLRDLIMGLVRTPTHYADRIVFLQELAAVVAKRFNELNIGVAGESQPPIDNSSGTG
jgi:CheY-like chemotaxis protein